MPTLPQVSLPKHRTPTRHGVSLEVSNDIAFLLPFGVTLGAIALAGSLALVMMAMRMRSDALLKRAARRTARAEAKFQKEAAIVSADPGRAVRVAQHRRRCRGARGGCRVLSGVLENDAHGDLKDALSTLGNRAARCSR